MGFYDRKFAAYSVSAGAGEGFGHLGGRTLSYAVVGSVCRALSG